VFLTRRTGVEWICWPDARAWCRSAYCLAQGRLTRHRGLVDFAERHDMTTAQAALAWLLANNDVIAIPKTSSEARVVESLGALAHPLDTAALAELDRLFPPPQGPVPLQMV
jgi:aldehyde reductase